MPDTSFPDLHAPTTPPGLEVGSAPVADLSRGMTLFVMIVATLYFGEEVLVPITLALLLAFVLAPLVYAAARRSGKSLLLYALPAALAFALVMYPMLRGDLQVTRREGAILVAGFLAWLAFELLIVQSLPAPPPV